MKRYNLFSLCILLVLFSITACQPNKKEVQTTKDTVMQRKLANYAKVKLSADLSSLSEGHAKLFSHLLKAADAIDELYWLQAYGDKNELLNKMGDDPDIKAYAMINYGPWDRLDGNAPFTDDYPPRPLGVGFFPNDMNQNDFFAIPGNDKFEPFTIVKKDNKGELKVLPYHIAYKTQIDKAVEHMRKGAESCDCEDFKAYLLQRAEDLLIDNFKKSDALWLNLKDNKIDFIAGPIENLEDHLIWTKYSYGAFILLRNVEWTENVKKFALLLPYLQKNLPVDEKYKSEAPEATSDIVIYDVLYNSGYCNAGNKLIGLNLPIGTEQVVSNSRKVHFKNVMEAKFQQILQPITNLVIDEKQRKHVKFTSFFQNTIFYEISNSLGISQTINNKGSVKDALKEHHAIIRELKNDVLRMFFITKLHEMNELKDVDLMDNYVTHMADVFRSIRFGVTDAQGVANMIRFNYFNEHEAFKYDSKTGTYKINDYKMKKAVESLSKLVLEIQGNGDYDMAAEIIRDKGYIHNELLNDLYRIQRAKIPKDVVYDQGDQLAMK
ncbi:Zn-dependent hydrolase [Ancylomarina euxinus]|uniref:Zn-dependent hydrolase n=1 Tax=Ancylomarina euxinus TaxID=2283627 RepID=A0A425XWY1_9BACT|nr:Zn-dependent hydrolase [Ancylomarina euxinus]MCZ4696295.1 Zn-dependent hydrolase [Ancylomarina euxinus]MUP16675.1 Zn-dependent hydrolase [Ancylomarina euxinus]RRG19151.1 Zn-dependent hydrolase [Ancylomarina euxinus]